MISFIYDRLVFLEGKNSRPQSEGENPAASKYHSLISVRVLPAGVGPTQTTDKKNGSFLQVIWYLLEDRVTGRTAATQASITLQFQPSSCQCKGFTLILHKSDIRIIKPGPSSGETGVQ